MTRIIRGKLKVLDTCLLFLNEDEEGRIDLVLSDELVTISIKLKELITPYKRPTILVSENEGGINLEFIGWGQPAAYALMEPINIASINDHTISIAACNTKLGVTNKLEIQFYYE